VYPLQVELPPYLILDFGCGPGRDLPVCRLPSANGRAAVAWGRYRRHAEGWNDGRYGTYLDLKSWRRFVSSAGFVELTHYYRPAGLPLERQPWLASIWRR
jgi:hypothetical protein